MNKKFFAGIAGMIVLVNTLIGCTKEAAIANTASPNMLRAAAPVAQGAGANAPVKTEAPSTEDATVVLLFSKEIGKERIQTSIMLDRFDAARNKLMTAEDMKAMMEERGYTAARLDDSRTYSAEVIVGSTQESFYMSVTQAGRKILPEIMIYPTQLTSVIGRIEKIVKEDQLIRAK